MPRPVVKNNNRVALRHTGGRQGPHHARRRRGSDRYDRLHSSRRAAEARSVIEEHERVKLTRRDSLLVLSLLENPPAPNAKLRKAARAMPERS